MSLSSCNRSGGGGASNEAAARAFVAAVGADNRQHALGQGKQQGDDQGEVTKFRDHVYSSSYFFRSKETAFDPGKGSWQTDRGEVKRKPLIAPGIFAPSGPVPRHGQLPGACSFHRASRELEWP